MTGRAPRPRQPTADLVGLVSNVGRAGRALRALTEACPAVMHSPEVRMLCVTVLTERLAHAAFAHPRMIVAALADRMGPLLAPALTAGLVAAAEIVLDCPAPQREAARDRLIELLIRCPHR